MSNITAVGAGNVQGLAISSVSAAPTLTSIAVTPVSPASLTVGTSQQFSATGTYSDSSTANITSQVTWNSSDTGIATISAGGSVSGVAAGSTDITAALSGVTSDTVTLTVVEATPTPTPTLTSTTTAVTSSSNPSDAGNSVTFTAAVSPQPDGGKVQFQDNGVDLGSASSVDSSGQATYTTSALAVGSHTIEAVYNGDSNFTGSTGSLVQMVGQSSANNTTTINGGTASVPVQPDGVSASISGSTAADGTSVSISSVDYGSTQPTRTGGIQLSGAQYYDVQVTGLGSGASGIARVSITSPSVTTATTMQYWYNGMWNNAGNVTVVDQTISGDIPVAAREARQ